MKTKEAYEQIVQAIMAADKEADEPVLRYEVAVALYGHLGGDQPIRSDLSSEDWEILKSICEPLPHGDADLAFLVKESHKWGQLADA